MRLKEPNNVGIYILAACIISMVFCIYVLALSGLFKILILFPFIHDASMIMQFVIITIVVLISVLWWYWIVHNLVDYLKKL